jgi:hypothetical protein
MNSRYLIIGLFLLLFRGAYGQTYSRVISDKDIVDFIKKIDKDIPLGVKKVDPQIMLWYKEQIVGDTVLRKSSKGIINQDSCKKYFSKTDFDFLTKQANSQLSKRWHKANFEKYVLINRFQKSEVFKKSISGKPSIKENYFYVFSIPLFNKKKDFAIIHYTYAAGFMFANQCTFLLKLNNSKWTVVKKWDCWSE